MSADASTLNLKTKLSQNVETLLRVSYSDLKVLMTRYEITDEIVIDMVNSVKEWLKKQPHLPQDHIHERQILGNLLLQGFSVERVKRSLESFYTARRRMPELLQGRDPEDKEWLWYLQQGFWVILPRKTEENNRVSILRIHSDIGGQVSQIIKMAFLLCEYRIWNDVAMGDCWILDCKNISLQQAMQMTPVMVAKTVHFLSSCFATKLKSVHLINMPPFGATILNLFKKGIKMKLVNRIHTCQPEDLLGIFPKELLPEEYGGTEMNCQKITEEWVKIFQSEPWRRYLVEQDSILTDESKRLTPTAADEFYGVEGSFRKLQLD